MAGTDLGSEVELQKMSNGTSGCYSVNFFGGKMKNYEFESEDMNIDDSSSMDFLSDSMSGFVLCDRMLEPESVVPSVDRNLVNLFLEYRRRVGRRGGSSKLTN